MTSRSRRDAGAQAAEAPPQHFLERGALGQRSRAGQLRLGLHVVHQRADEERAAARLRGDARGHGGGHRKVAAQQLQRQPLGVGRFERADDQFTPLARERHVLAQQGRQARAVGDVLGPVRSHQQHGGRVRLAEDVQQQAGAVRVAPLQVVDDQHQRLRRGQRAEQLRQGHRRARPQFLRAEDGPALTGARMDPVDPLEHREHLRQQRHVVGQQPVDHVRRQLAQVAAERVDQAVERLVAHRLLLVAAPRQHQRLRSRVQGVDEVVDDRALAHARRPVHEQPDGSAGHRRAKRVLQRFQMPLAADQVHGHRLGDDGRRGRAAAKHRQDIGGRRPLGGLDREQLHAELLEGHGHFRVEQPRRIRLDVLLGRPARRTSTRQTAAGR